MNRELFKKYQPLIIEVFIISLWILFTYFFFLTLMKPIYQDEGVFLTIGRGIFEGKLPYLNFWDHKPPGIYFLWSLLYPIFGLKMIFYKLFIWMINFFTAILLFGISEKMKAGSGKFSVIIFLCSLVFFEGNYLGAGPFLAFFITLSTWFLLNVKNKYSAVFVGTSLAMAIIFKQTAIFSLFPFIIYYAWKKEYWNIAKFLIGLLTILAILVFWLFGNNILFEFWNQVFISSSKNYPPEPIKKVIIIWAETFARVWWLWFGVVFSFFSAKKISKEFIFIILLSFLPIITFFVRHYPHYWLQVLPFLTILAGLGFYYFFENIFNTKYWFVGIILIGYFVISFTQNLLWFNWVTKNYNQPKQQEETAAVEFLKTLPKGKILTENRYTSFNFLSERDTLTKYLYLTEVNEREKAREKTMFALESEQNVVILWPTSSEYVYAKEIGSWLQNNAKKIKEYPNLEMSVFIKN